MEGKKGDIKRIKRFRPDDLGASCFKEGCLVSIGILGIWGASTKLGSDYITSTLPDKLVRANYDILEDKSRIDRLNSLREEAKKFVEKCSMPFPLQNCTFVRKEVVPIVEEGLEERKARFFEVLDTFLDEEYEDGKRSFQKKYPEHYHERKYPSKKAMRDRINFDWCYRVFEPPGKNSGILTPAMYKKELAKFKDDMDRMRTMMLHEVKEQFIAKVETLRDQCLDGVPNASTLRSVNTFLDRFESYWKGSVGTEGIQELVTECKEYLDGTDADMLRSDDEFKSVIGNAMKGIAAGFEEIAGERLTRSIDL